MRAVFILILAVLACATEEVVAPNPEDFIKGFLEAIKEKKTVEDLKKCMTNMDPIFEKIKKALALFMKLTFPDILEGLKILKAAMEELHKMLEPCLKEFSQFQKLIKAIKEASLVNIAYKILWNAKTFIKDIQDAIEAFKKMDLYKAGKSIGDILYRVFLERLNNYEASGMVLFIEGFLKGIHEKQTIEELLKCIEKAEHIWIEIKKAFELLKKFTLPAILEGLSILFKAFKELHDILHPCLDNYPEFHKLLHEIINADIFKIIAKIMSDPIGFFAEIIEAYNSIMKGDYKKAGEDVGDLLYKQFLKK
jgi:tetratricopeptide (TPR) repeat protein